jgi:hypothetical protein
MKVSNPKILSAIFILLLLFGTVSPAATHGSEAVVLSANGEGRVKVGREEFKLIAVVVKLLEDGTAEISLVSDITIFVSAKWTRSGNDADGISLEITGGATKGGLEGNGKLFLRDDKKSIASLTLLAVNKSTKKNIDVQFTAK